MTVYLNDSKKVNLDSVFQLLSYIAMFIMF